MNKEMLMQEPSNIKRGTMWCMGRPLWMSVTDRLGNGQPSYESRKLLVDYAERKLLVGAQYAGTEATMNGVASAFCRIGLRFHPSCGHVPYFVGSLMAVLSSVDYDRNEYVGAYPSDPILTFGAARLWTFDCLARRILPELRDLISSELVETGPICGVVAHIVLLLAMDNFLKRAHRFFLSFFTMCLGF